jgi:hypothetical protein
MQENQFTVDLGDLKLNEEQRRRINGAIQKAVAGELATISLAKEVVLIPAFKWPKGRGPIINGLIIRDFLKLGIKENAFQEKLG